MPGQHEEDKIGSRWREFLGRVQTLRISEHEMTNDQRLFLSSLENRLIVYREDTALTRKQRNWLTHLENEFLEHSHGPLR